MRTTLWLWLGLSLCSAGCLISGYDERARLEDAAQLPDFPKPGGSDAGVTHDIDIDAGDAGAERDLDAGDHPLMDAQLDPPDDDDGGRSDVEAWCANHPCGDVKGCTGPDCDLLCSAAAPVPDAGRDPVDCTFDCDGSERCDTSCGSALECQTSCIGSDRCYNTCKTGASCSVYCADALCGGSCERGSRCAFLCPPGGCGDIYCKAGAACVLRCGGSGPIAPNTNDSTCKFALCEDRMQQRCGDGRTVVCGRPCPMR